MGYCCEACTEGEKKSRWKRKGIERRWELSSSKSPEYHGCCVGSKDVDIIDSVSHLPSVLWRRKVGPLVLCGLLEHLLHLSCSIVVFFRAQCLLKRLLGDVGSARFEDWSDQGAHQFSCVQVRSW